MQENNTTVLNISRDVLPNSTNNSWVVTPGSKQIYAASMFFILSFGFVGNVMTIIVFLQREQRTKIIAPFVINLAIADLFIVVFGYPVAMTANLSGIKLATGESRCTWSAFVNGATGIASIAMLTEISVLMCYTICSMTPTPNSSKLNSKRFKILVLAGAWIYGILSMSPPLLGWSRFIPGSAGISCCPDWSSNDIQALTYNIGLVTIGFFMPATTILISYCKMYRCLTVSSILTRQEALIRRRRHSQFKVARMIGVAVLAFLVSWSPYCIVSLIAVFKNSFILRDGEAEIPELMAKASVIYNPLVYALMNVGFRRTVKRLLKHRSCYNDGDDSQATPEIVTTKVQLVRVGGNQTSSETTPMVKSKKESTFTNYI